MIEIGKATFNEKNLIKLLEAVKRGDLKRPRPRGWIAEDFIFKEEKNENKKNKRKKDNPLRD
jgi:hypothetical protein